MAFMTALGGALDRLYGFCGLIAAVLLVLLTGLILTSILARLVGVFIGGITEYAGYAMAASAFFAMSYTFRSGGHIRVAMVISRFGGSSRRGLEIWCRGFMTVITGFLAFYMCRLAYFSWLYDEISEGGDAIPLWIPQVPVAIGAIIFFISALDSLVRVLVSDAAMDDAVTAGGSDP